MPLRNHRRSRNGPTTIRPIKTMPQCGGTRRRDAPMSSFQRGETTIYYETRGAGFPLLLLPPGGMNATIGAWDRSAFAPMEIFPRDFWSITLDERNAGRSIGPLAPDDPWGSYAEDQLGLMNHLGIERFHVLGCCIECSYT